MAFHERISLVAHRHSYHVSYITRNKIGAPNVQRWCNFDEGGRGAAAGERGRRCSWVPQMRGVECQSVPVNNPSPWKRRRGSIACLRPLTRLIARSLIPISRGTSDPFSKSSAFCRCPSRDVERTLRRAIKSTSVAADHAEFRQKSY